MKILFFGNSLLIALLNAYKRNNAILGPDVECSFFIEIGGPGPGCTIEEDKIILSSRADKDKRPEVMVPADLLDIPISQYDAVVFVALGRLHGMSLDKDVHIGSYGQMYEFGPKVNALTNIAISKSAYSEMVNYFTESQVGVSLMRSLKGYKFKRIVVEQPLLSDSIKDHPDWILRKLYDDPIAALNFFQTQRRITLTRICEEEGVHFIPALFDKEGFTPSHFSNEVDLFHTNHHYADLLFKEISQALAR